MKISSFYMKDISAYENFIDKLIQDIDLQFFNTGYNSLNMGRFIHFFRTEITQYINFKYNKKIIINIKLPKNDSVLIDKTTYNNKEKINVCLSYMNIKNILNGENTDYPSYINILIEQIDSIINAKPTHEFNDYLIIQMDNLVQICYGELITSYSKEFISNNLKKPTSWVKLARQSAIFNDYYKFYQQNKSVNKKYFLKFLQKLYTM